MFRSVNGRRSFWRGRVTDAASFTDTDTNGEVEYSIVAIQDFERFKPVRCNTADSGRTGITECTVERSGDEFIVSWVGGTDADRIVIRRQVDGSPWYWRGRVASTETTFVDPARGNDVDYRVFSKVGAKLSAPTNCDTVDR